MKSDFTNNMTHELKTPIAVAYAANDALLNFDITKDQTKTKKYLTIGQQQLRRLSGLVEQILSMSMERRKNMKLNIEEVIIQPILESLIAEQNFKADIPVDISFNIPKDLSIKVDRNHFAHIISNLLDNAIKYSTGKAEIKVTAHKDKDYTEITIADKGIGIATDKQKYIFDKFYRVPHGNLYEVKGYGLGLYYVKSMMDRFHGNISVKSELGKGTTFKLRFYD
jgi:signal transduction histidine kinase